MKNINKRVLRCLCERTVRVGNNDHVAWNAWNQYQFSSEDKKITLPLRINRRHHSDNFINEARVERNSKLSFSTRLNWIIDRVNYFLLGCLILFQNSKNLTNSEQERERKTNTRRQGGRQEKREISSLIFVSVDIKTCSA